MLLHVSLAAMNQWSDVGFNGQEEDEDRDQDFSGKRKFVLFF